MTVACSLCFSDCRGAGTDAGVYIELIGDIDGKAVQVILQSTPLEEIAVFYSVVQ